MPSVSGSGCSPAAWSSCCATSHRGPASRTSSRSSPELHSATHRRSVAACPPMTFPTSSPSAQGVDPSAISAFVDALEDDSRIEPHGLIIQRHGVRIAEGYWAPHRPEHLRLVYSLSKSFTGTALGLQVGEGRLS